MKRQTRLTYLLLCMAILCALLAGCGGGTKDVPVADLAGAVLEATGKTGTLAESDGIFRILTGKDAETLGEHTVWITVVGSGIDQFGIFKAGTLSTKELQTAAQDYITGLANDNLNNSYFPEESAKLNTAEVRVVGNYVMYCVMSDEDMSAAFSAFEKALK